MKIAQISPLSESVPPALYGGTERIVSYLTEELVQMGHQVTLFASGDSKTSATLCSMCPHSLRLNHPTLTQVPYYSLLEEFLFQRASEFEVIHSHVESLLFPLIRRIKTPALTTFHGRLDLEEMFPVLTEFKDSPVISISNSQRQPFPNINWAGTVYHGIPVGLFEYVEKPKAPPDHYLAFLGRISPEKRPDLAIEIAKRTGIKLKIAAKIDKADEDYYVKVIEPLLNHGLVEFIGEIEQNQKNEFLGNALALLFPIDWPEPFGLVMIESMACGTPVIAKNNGSVAEVVENGVTGFIFTELEDAVKAVKTLSHFDRKACRKAFEKRFSARHMAENYIKIYENIILERGRI